MLEHCLPDVSKTALKNSQATKMSDNLVFALFSWKDVQKGMILCPLLIPILMLPSLLLQVFYNPHLTKLDRYMYMKLGAAIIFIHTISFYYGDSKLSVDEVYPVNEQDLHKYMLLAVCVTVFFLGSEPFDLADCTSHLLEHFFGLIRRFSAGNNSKEKFEESLKKAFCLQTWLKKRYYNNEINMNRKRNECRS